jgi:hypothetical protein
MAASRPVRKVGPPEARRAFERLSRARALTTLVRGALPTRLLKRLLRDAMPPRIAREMPPEVWPSLASGIALESEAFGSLLAQALHDRLAFDHEPSDIEEWLRLVAERPLEALWMAALSETRSVRKEFAHISEHALENFRTSPAWTPPSWEFVEGILDVQAQTVRDLQDAEKKAEDSERRFEAERERLDELREDLKRLRRENSEIRGEKAVLERRAVTLEAEARSHLAEAERIQELEKRLRRAEKEREHLARELERAEESEGTRPRSSEASPLDISPPKHADPLETDGNPRRRLLRQMLRKLFNKGKIGASHTHEDNVYKGVPDHEKGIAKDAIALLYREGLLLPKPTATDPHVSLSPDRTNEIQAIIAGEIANPRIQRFVET